MMNVKADEYALGTKFVYIEEYTSGSFNKLGYFDSETINMQVYFCKFSELHTDADIREAIRQEIRTEIVRPFMEKYNQSGLFSVVNNWRYLTPLPRFDANEVSIMLQFDCTKVIC